MTRPSQEVQEVEISLSTSSLSTSTMSIASDSESSSSSSSPSSPSPPPAQRLKSTKHSKKAVTEPVAVAADERDWSYTPPVGAKLLDHSVDTCTFDWDAVNDDNDLELWLVRVPTGVSLTL